MINDLTFDDSELQITVNLPETLRGVDSSGRRAIVSMLLDDMHVEDLESVVLEALECLEELGAGDVVIEDPEPAVRLPVYAKGSVVRIVGLRGLDSLFYELGEEFVIHEKWVNEYNDTVLYRKSTTTIGVPADQLELVHE